MAHPSTDALLHQITAEVAALPEESLRAVLPALAQAERETATALEAWLAQHPDGRERFTAQHHRQVLLQLREAKKSIARRMRRSPKWVGDLENAVKDAFRIAHASGARMATRHIRDEVAHFSSKFGDPVPISLDNAVVFARGKKLLAPRFKGFAKRYSVGVWEDVKRQLSIGVARSETIDQLTKRLQRLGGPGAKSPAEGLFIRQRHVAERLVRTETINAYNASHHAAIQEMNADGGGFLKRWDATADMRVCATCKGLHEKTVEPDELFDGLYEHPPAHPNCRCAVVTWHPDWDDEKNSAVEPAHSSEIPPLPPSQEPEYRKVPARQAKNYVSDMHNRLGVGEKLTDDQKHYVSAYQTNLFSGLNKTLRGLPLNDDDKYVLENFLQNNNTSFGGLVRDLSEAVGKNKLDEPLMVYRQCSVDAAHFAPGGKFSSVFVDEGFVSTSVSKRVTDDFPGTVLMEIQLPQGTRVLPVKTGARVDSEAEILLDPRAKMKVVSVTRSGSLTTVRLTHTGEYVDDKELEELK